jgi:hypothetical protein|tara:strand:+ start:199 stop:426 length:228 start_codon:yes stop_codon:yes gene_type:complete
MIKLKDILEEDYKKIVDILSNKTGIKIGDQGGRLPFAKTELKFSKITSDQFKKLQKLVGDNANILISLKNLKIKK